MQYMMLIYEDRSLSPRDNAEATALSNDSTVYANGLEASGTFVMGAPLAAEQQAKTVRRRRGKTAVLDGPFAETKEWLAGFCVIEADSLEHALEIAKQCPGAEYGSVEVRRIMKGSQAS